MPGEEVGTYITNKPEWVKVAEARVIAVEALPPLEQQRAVRESFNAIMRTSIVAQVPIDIQLQSNVADKLSRSTAVDRGARADGYYANLLFQEVIAGPESLAKKYAFENAGARAGELDEYFVPLLVSPVESTEPAATKTHDVNITRTDGLEMIDRTFYALADWRIVTVDKRTGRPTLNRTFGVVDPILYPLRNMAERARDTFMNEFGPAGTNPQYDSEVDAEYVYWTSWMIYVASQEWRKFGYRHGEESFSVLAAKSRVDQVIAGSSSSLESTKDWFGLLAITEFPLIGNVHLGYWTYLQIMGDSNLEPDLTTWRNPVLSIDPASRIDPATGKPAYLIRGDRLRNKLLSLLMKVDPMTGLPETNPITGLPEIDPSTGRPVPRNPEWMTDLKRWWDKFNLKIFNHYNPAILDKIGTRPDFTLDQLTDKGKFIELGEDVGKAPQDAIGRALVLTDLRAYQKPNYTQLANNINTLIASQATDPSRELIDPKARAALGLPTTGSVTLTPDQVRQVLHLPTDAEIIEQMTGTPWREHKPKNTMVDSGWDNLFGYVGGYEQGIIINNILQNLQSTVPLERRDLAANVSGGVVKGVGKGLGGLVKAIVKGS